MQNTRLRRGEASPDQVLNMIARLPVEESRDAGIGATAPEASAAGFRSWALEVGLYDLAAFDLDQIDRRECSGRSPCPAGPCFVNTMSP